MTATPYQSLTDPSRLGPMVGTWLIWLITAAILSLVGAALIARLINRPSNSRLRPAVCDGDFDASSCSTNRWPPARSAEVNSVSTAWLSKIEEDRVIMLPAFQ
jgi:two-component system osmolarity sensor histidine kinase EnvZ